MGYKPKPKIWNLERRHTSVKKNTHKIIIIIMKIKKKTIWRHFNVKNSDFQQIVKLIN